MTLSQSRSKALDRLYAFRVPHEVAIKMIDQILFWSSHSGEEWTVSRLKELRVDLVRKLAGSPPVGTYKKHSDLTPCGPFRYFFRDNNLRSRQQLRTAFRALSIYKSFVSPGVTVKQMKKFRSSVARSYVACSMSPTYSKGMLAELATRSSGRLFSRDRLQPSASYYRNIRPGRTEDLESWISSPSRVAPGLDEIEEPYDDDPYSPVRKIQKPVRKKEEDMDIELHLRMVAYDDYVLEGFLPLIKAKVPEVYHNFLSGGNLATSSYASEYSTHLDDALFGSFSEPDDFGLSLGSMDRLSSIQGIMGSGDPFLSDRVEKFPFHVGAVSYIQEPGYKLRAIANPSRIVQFILSDLGDTLFRMLKGIPEDSTFDQRSGMEKARSFINGVDTVYSVDISDATNNFPLDYTMEVLGVVSKAIPELQESIRFFKFVSRSPWLTPDDSMIRWTVGQPLGLYPSFPAFALSHHCLLYDLRKVHGGDYVVLGDDVVIVGDDLHNGYRRALSEMAVPVSEEKSLSSVHCCEFAGKTIFRDFELTGHRYSRISNDSFFDIVKELGPRFVKTLPKRLRTVIDCISPLPEPFGFGWNTEGLPLLDRLPDGLLERYLKGSPLSGETSKVSNLKRLFSPLIVGSNKVIPRSSIRNSLRNEIAQNDLPRPLPSDLLDPLLTLYSLHRQGVPIARNLSEMEYGLRGAYRNEFGELVFSEEGIDALLRLYHSRLVSGSIPKGTMLSRFRSCQKFVTDFGLGKP